MTLTNISDSVISIASSGSVITILFCNPALDIFMNSLRSSYFPNMQFSIVRFSSLLKWYTGNFISNFSFVLSPLSLS